MRNLSEYITEKLKIRKDTDFYHYHPKSKHELKELINKLLEERGKDADLNDIDVSEITDMSELFAWSKFNGDISKWNISNVENMSYMFFGSKFNGDISNWDVDNVKDMSLMFSKSQFNGDVSKWNVNKHVKRLWMFNETPLSKNKKLPAWYEKTK